MKITIIRLWMPYFRWSLSVRKTQKVWFNYWSPRYSVQQQLEVRFGYWLIYIPLSKVYNK